MPIQSMRLMTAKEKYLQVCKIYIKKTVSGSNHDWFKHFFLQNTLNIRLKVKIMM